MSLQYRVLYRLGFTPWEQMAKFPVREQLISLLEQEAHDRGGSPGTALDLGCGSGIWAAELARRGWTVTGVDVVKKAVAAARRRAETTAGSMTFIEGDVSRVDSLGLGTFDFLLDVSCFHELDDARRVTMGRAVNAVAADNATMLIHAFQRRGRNPMLPRGATVEDLQAAFTEWSVIDEVPSDFSGAPAVIRNADPRFFRFRRNPAHAAT